MYKIMLVEDEALVRDNMTQHIDWAHYGFQLACACENGQEAIDRFPAVLPNVVITDICMPLVDGLELARYLQANYPSVFVVMLTGYQEFEYARRAVKLRVHDFVLKPVVPGEFCAMLAKLAAELNERSNWRDDIQNLYNRAQQAESVLKNVLFKRILQEQMTPAALTKAAGQAGVVFSCEVYCVLMAEALDNAAQRSVRLSQQLLDAAQSTAVRFPHCVCGLIDDRYLMMILGGRTRAGISERARDAGNMLVSAIQRVCLQPAQVGIGGCCTDTSDLHRCAQEAFHALGYGFSLECSVMIDQRELASERKITADDPLPPEREIARAVQAHNFQEAQAALDALFDAIRRRRLHRSACVPALQHLQFGLSDMVPPELQKAAPGLPPEDEWYRSGYVQRKLSQLIAFIAQCALPSCDDPAKRCVHDAEQYIRAHFGDTEFSLSELLANLNTSKSYFSAAFKAQTGQTFVEYLTGVRIDYAKYLLRATTLCNYEIAERVGFSDPHYFSVTFKRCAGMTPREYREAGA